MLLSKRWSQLFSRFLVQLGLIFSQQALRNIFTQISIQVERSRRTDNNFYFLSSIHKNLPMKKQTDRKRPQTLPVNKHRTADGKKRKNKTTGGTVCKPGRVTVNPFFNFVREIRKISCGKLQKEIIKRAALLWHHMTLDQKCRFREKAIEMNAGKQEKKTNVNKTKGKDNKTQRKPNKTMHGHH